MEHFAVGFTVKTLNYAILTKNKYKNFLVIELAQFKTISSFINFGINRAYLFIWFGRYTLYVACHVMVTFVIYLYHFLTVNITSDWHRSFFLNTK